VTPDGKVKLLDFGLAKIFEGEAAGGSSPSLTHSPTLTGRATAIGVILGTAACMPPEQARGKTLDKRTDIWAFGCVLYEMLTGRRLFHGEDVSETLAAVLRADPDWNALPAGTAPAVRRLLHRCLERDPRRRLRHIGDASIEIDEAMAGPSSEGRVSASAAVAPLRVWQRPSALLAGALLLAGLSGAAARAALRVRAAGFFFLAPGRAGRPFRALHRSAQRLGPSGRHRRASARRLRPPGRELVRGIAPAGPGAEVSSI